MKKQHRNQQLVRMKTLIDSNDDDDMTSTSSISMDNDNESDHSSKITNLMRENERKIRSLSESYMNRFILAGQQLQTTNALALPSTTRTIVQRMPSDMQLETMTSSSLSLFIETLKQLIIKEERKRGLNLVLCIYSVFFFELKKNRIYLRMMILDHRIHTHVFRLE
jgi:hypothetical protein